MSSAPDRDPLAAHDPASALDVERPVGEVMASSEGQAVDGNLVLADGAGRGDRPNEDRDRDWAWVEEWRLSEEPVPWGPGLAVAAFCALVVGIAVWVLTAGLADIPLLSLGANVLVALGLAPALWLSRSLPVLRWIAGGGAAGVVIAWLAALVVLT